MDAEDIFRKLTVGAVFAKGSHCSIPESSAGTFIPPVVETVFEAKSTSTAIKPAKEEPSEECITLLGNIKSDSINRSLTKGNTKKKDKIREGKSTPQTKIREEINHLRNIHRIKVVGKDVPDPFETFDELETKYQIPAAITQNVLKCGYTKPTPIQMQAIPIMLQNKPILATAPTGSGKTLAFLIPIIFHLKRRRKDGFRALIVSPTRELSKQTYRECERMCDGTGLKVHMITKANLSPEKFGPNYSNKFDILITTPNRLLFLLNFDTPVLNLKKVEWLIVDESDKLFEAGKRGFRDQLATIYQACDCEHVKRAMFSATYTPEVAKWCRRNLKGLISVTIGMRNTTVDIEQELVFVGSEEGKLIEMRYNIKKGLAPPVLIFVQSKERARELFTELIYDGINVDVIHADRTQKQRDNTVQAFREGKIWVLICTELMGRGIDFKGVNLVINYDFPQTAISYIHRIGRTGRAGRPGKAITFFTKDDIPFVRSIANVMKASGCNIPDYIMSLKRPSKKMRKKLSVPERAEISAKPHKYKSLIEKNKSELRKKIKNKESHLENGKKKVTFKEKLKSGINKSKENGNAMPSLIDKKIKNRTNKNREGSAIENPIKSKKMKNEISTLVNGKFKKNKNKNRENIQFENEVKGKAKKPKNNIDAESNKLAKKRKSNVENNILFNEKDAQKLKKRKMISHINGECNGERIEESKKRKRVDFSADSKNEIQRTKKSKLNSAYS